ncbi:S9 family peptidase [Parvularcula sp. ZS-1/3]|uniref:S9 family peptidase n=1 Tax=Parvularcula mediterranea TaxID=2732508 RepID=A0A7Y3RLY3_9PROT|nr:S9 family peptidase [Parvularcula mediterranea]NNU15762.1 S9 family peptidase [Parvularcula mediterranea]
MSEAPKAEKRPLETVQHGETRIDPYHWMRDDNWQEVLRDPTVLKDDVREHLEAENAYYKAQTDHLEKLRDLLFQEMRGRIKENDSSVPMRDGPYEYYARYREGGQYPVYARRTEEGADEEIMLDGDKEGEGKDFYSIGGVDVSWDHELLAVSTDTLGSEYYDIRVRNLKTGEELPDQIGSTDGSVVWAKDNKSFFYVERDDHQRPKRVKHHLLGDDPSGDRLVYEEESDEMFLSIGETASDAYMVISLGNGNTSEEHLVPLDAPETAPKLVEARKSGVLYSVDHKDDTLFIHTNADDAVDFKIVTAPEESPGRENWKDWLPHTPGTYVAGVELFKDWIVREERFDAKPRIIVGRYDRTGEHELSQDEDAFSLSLIGWGEFETDTIRYAYESPAQPAQVFDYDMATRVRTLRKTQEIPSGHNADAYVVDRIDAKARDGESIPLVTIRRKDIAPNGDLPVVLYGYGSYGIYIDDDFSSHVLSFVDRGAVFAVAHIRGGSAKGRQWYLDGKLEKKENTFRDFNDCAQALIDEGITKRGRIVGYGGSAGGLLVGAAVNLDPGLYGGIIGAVPFIDVVNTISDGSLPLTPPEWEEWGNPITDKAAFATISAYSPYDNIRAGETYPPVLATGGLTDYRVTYWEPAKWIARLRDEAEGGPFLLRMNMTAGHGGSAARFERIKERAADYAFALDILGLAEAEPDRGL